MTWHVVHVITRLDLGGAQLATLYEVARGEFGAYRSLIYGTGGMLDAAAAALTDVTCYPLPSLRWEMSPVHDLRALRDIERILTCIKRADPRGKLLVHTHSSKAGILGRAAARWAGADLIVHTAHGFGHSHHGSGPVRWLFTAAEVAAGRITDGFTADSAANIHQGRAEGLFGDAPARVVRCGIDVGAFANNGADGSGLRARLGIPADHKVVLNLSCLKAQKDPIAFTRLAARVIEELPSTTFLLAGDGDLRAAVEAYATRLSLDDRFRLLGWRRDAPELLALADLLVLTSRWEGLPQVFAQAMAAGVPIIATRVDGVPEAVSDGDNGLLFAPGDIAGMAAATVRLLRDDALRAAMGASGVGRAELFSQERMVATLEGFYRQLAG